ncbi:MAG: YfiR family protein [Bacteroidota bacterium]
MKNSISTIVFCALFFSGTAKAQDYKFHSLFVYNFTKYIQWPESAQSGDFVIGVFGNSAITSELEKLVANKTVGAQKIVVRKVHSIAEADKLQILFIPQNKSKEFDAIQQSLKGKPVLLVTEKDGFGKKGSGINFVILDGKMRFELNLAATQMAGLKVSSQLSSLAML